ncbi:MAG: metallophosphoesterase [Propioniciclava sp.]|uniref:metallophosphoesterase n=1 Tax=Propioniciclava sp. TaxID=2038686 RepID=UPI0039E51203
MLRRLGAATVALAGACFAYGVLIERTAFQVRRFTVPVLPPGALPVKVLHISDAHLLPRQGRKRDFMRGLAGLEPDLVVNTGDNVSSADALAPLVESLGRLREVPGVFVFGSNDHKAPRFKVPTRYLFGNSGSSGESGKKSGRRSTRLPTAELQASLERLGWVYLEERSAEMTVRGTTFRFRGTSDAHDHLDDYAKVVGPASGDAVEVGVTHAPYLRVLDAMTADGLDLIFAGHTHGGQVCVPGHGALTTNSDLPARHAKGLFTHTSGGHTASVHVSAGFGMSPFAPYRFACPPEVSLLTLVPRPE